MEKQEKAYKGVIEYFKNRIMAGELRPGEKLPPEREIAQMLEVSRNSVREALRIMDMTGVISSQQGSGNYITCEFQKSIAETMGMMFAMSQINYQQISQIRYALEQQARICLEDGRKLRIYHDLPMSIPFETFQKAKSIHIRDAALMTVENLTSFHRLEREHIFYLFLSGYHTRTKQALLQRIARENPGLSWHHFGDLDPDGLAIAGHLIRKTGLPFQLCAMGVQELQRFQTYAKPLEAPDRAKAEAMIKQGSSYAGILRYMLEHNCKLEQEIISWQETRLESFL